MDGREDAAVQYLREDEKIGMAKRAHVVFFPGLGADHRLFTRQREAGLSFEVPAFPMPHKREAFADYARRVGRQAGVDGRTVVGGVSFGGMLAYQAAVECGARAVVLISSCTSGQAIPNHYRVAERIARVLPDRFLRQRVAFGSRMLAKLEGLNAADAELVQLMAREASIPFLRRAGQMVLRWVGSRTAPCRIFALHGAADRVIPIGKVRPTQIISGAGHLLCLSHAPRVTEFIENSLHALADDQQDEQELSSLAG